MSRLALSLAFWDYDRTLPLVDGRVPIEGCQPWFALLRPEDAFARAFGTAEFDVSEMSMSNYITALSKGPVAYVAIPVFPSRAFRYGALYARTDRAISGPRDLAGKLVGLQEYEMTAAVVVRGMLRDEFGVRPQDIRWRLGDVERDAGRRLVRPEVPSAIDVRPVATGRTLDSMLALGELDALFSLRTPPSFASGHPKIARLFPDWRAAEREYFEKTGIFPIMHTVGVRRTLLAENPWLAKSLFKAFARAKDLALAELADGHSSALPWVADELAATRALMGYDFWPYGFAANRPTVETILHWSREDGLQARPVEAEELFAPSTLDT